MGAAVEVGIAVDGRRGGGGRGGRRGGGGRGERRGPGRGDFYSETIHVYNYHY